MSRGSQCTCRSGPKSLIDRLVHRIEKDDFEVEVRSLARHVRDVANEAAAVTAESWCKLPKSKG